MIRLLEGSTDYIDPRRQSR